MRKSRIKIIWLIFIAVGCITADADVKNIQTRLKIVGTTSMMGSIAEEIGGDYVEVHSIVPGGMCPGHFDIKPSCIKAVSESGVVVLYHGWEEWIDELVKSAGAEPKQRFKIEVKGSWMVPDNHIMAAEKIYEIISDIDPQNKNYYYENLNEYINQIKQTIELIKNKSKRWKGKKAVCSLQQAMFLKWLGLEIVDTYGRAEDMSPKEISKILEKSKKENAEIVVDNLQSSSQIGQLIKKQMDSEYVILSNFPIKQTYICELKENVNKISEVLYK